MLVSFPRCFCGAKFDVELVRERACERGDNQSEFECGSAMRWLAMSLSIVVIVVVVVDDVGFALLAEALHKRNTLHTQIVGVCAC